MPFTYDDTTDRGRVRLLITDVESTDYCFEDSEIDAFLAMAGGSVYKASALGLMTIAINEALVQKRIKLLDITTDGPAVAKALNEKAKEYLELAKKESIASTGGFDWAESVYDQFSYLEKVLKEALRGG